MIPTGCATSALWIGDVAAAAGEADPADVGFEPAVGTADALGVPAGTADAQAPASRVRIARAASTRTESDMDSL